MGIVRGLKANPNFGWISKLTITPHVGAQQPFHPRCSFSSLAITTSFHFKDSRLVLFCSCNFGTFGYSDHNPQEEDECLCPSRHALV